MRKFPVDKLTEIPSLPAVVLHESGTILLRKGEALDAAIIQKLREKEVENVFFLGKDEPIEAARHALTHQAVEVAELVDGEPLGQSVFDADGQLLLEAGASISAKFATSLQQRGISLIYLRRPARELKVDVGKTLKRELSEVAKENDSAKSETLAAISALEVDVADSSLFSPEALDERIRTHDINEIIPEGEAFSKGVFDSKKAGQANEQQKTEISGIVSESSKTLTKVFADLGDGSGKLDIQGLDFIASQAMSGVIKHRELMMLLGTASEQNGLSYLVQHSLAVTTLAVNIGATMGFGAKQIKSLAYGAILADVGMLRVGKTILDKTAKLTPREHAEIKMHPVHGLDILEKCHHLPEAVPYIVYQSHERANGTGYPRGKTDVVIHPFARIVALADIYASICAKRPYREARTPYEGMEAVVVGCGKRQLNPVAAKAFLQCNSMFPVGSFVQLSDGRTARVVYANHEEYMRPQVAVLRDAKGQNLTTSERVDLLAERNLKVVKALTAADAGFENNSFAGF